MQIQVREKCPYYECDGGYVQTEDRPDGKIKMKKCSTCKGKGYIEAWMSVASVLAKTMIFKDI